MPVFSLAVHPSASLPFLIADNGHDNSPGSHAVGTPASTVSPLHSLSSLGDGGVLPWPQGLDTGEGGVAVTALGGSRQLLDVQVTQLSTGGLDDTTTVRLGVVWGALAQSNSLGHLREGGNEVGRGGESVHSDRVYWHSQSSL